MDTISKQISVVYRLSQMFIAHKMRAYGLNQTQIASILFIAERDSVQQHEIAEYFALDKGTVSNMIKKLKSNGFINKQADPYDKRASVIRLTYKSTLLLGHIKEANIELRNGLFRGFTDADIKTILKSLDRMKDNIEEIHERKLELS